MDRCPCYPNVSGQGEGVCSKSVAEIGDMKQIKAGVDVSHDQPLQTLLDGAYLSHWTVVFKALCLVFQCNREDCLQVGPTELSGCDEQGFRLLCFEAVGGVQYMQHKLNVHM